MARRPPSLRARLAAAGLDARSAHAQLSEAGLLVGGPTGDDDEVAHGLLPLLSEAASPDDALAAIVTIARGSPDLFAQMVEDRGWLERIAAVAGASRPLGELLARFPDAAVAVRSDEGVDIDDIARHVEQAVLEGAHATERAAGIAAIRRTTTAAIASRDLTGGADVEEVARELAGLADGVLLGTLAAVHTQVAGDDPKAKLAVIGMGKLGGIELNYVSDVDVVFVHEPHEGIHDEQAGREATQVFSVLLELLNASTTMGRAYEVDPTLRPEGRTGALSRTVPSYVAYWERWAKTWEFQALLKARPVAGDRDLAMRWLRSAEPFVWPEQLDAGVVAEIRDMKSRIESTPEVLRHGERQLKLGPGGIRDIEFAVQLLQLVHGRGDRSLRHTGTLPALTALVANGYVDEEDAARFATAYRRLRTIEHRLQLAHERRTHTVPDDAQQQERIARALGYRASGDRPARDRFRQDLSATQAEVRELHAKLFYRPLLERYATLPSATAGVSVPGEISSLGEQAGRDRLIALGFRDGAAALRDIRALTSGLTRQARTLRAVLPAVLQVLQDTPDPDRGLASFRDLVQGHGGRAELLSYLRDHPAATELLGRVLGTSPVAGELLRSQPQGIEWLRDSKLREQPRDAQALTRMGLARLHWQDPDAAIRRFKRLELLRIVLRDLSDAAGVGTIGAELSALAQACVAAGLQAEIEQRARTIGIDDPEDLPVRIAVIGMGRLGGEELHYASDLDVLFVHEIVDDDADPKIATQLAIEIVTGVMRSLSAITEEGSAYEIDADLRPEGRSGPLSRSLASYTTYWRRWAQPWELQMLVRARFVAGARDLGTRFVTQASEHAYGIDDVESALAAMRQMKVRLEKERIPKRLDPQRHLKLGPGGISDVEWTVQLLQVRHGRDRELVRAPSTMEALDRLQDADLISGRDAAWLREGYRFQSAVRNRLYLLRHRDVDSLPQNRDHLETLARSLGYGRGGWQQLEDDRRKHARHVRQVCERLFYGIEPDPIRTPW